MAANEFVYVGCKMPSGVVLHLRQNENQGTPQMPVIVTNGDEHGEVRLKGTSRKFGQPDLSIDGYVFTRVPKDFWEKWLALNAGSSLLRDHFIKAAATVDAGHKMAREMEAMPGQSERIAERDPKNKNRTPADLASRGASLGVKKYEADDDRAAA